MLRAFMLRREKDILAQQLPKKEDHVVFCALPPLQMRVYARVLKSPDFQLIVRAHVS